MALTFSGSSSFLDKHEMLSPIVGSGFWFSEFRPVRFPNLNTFHKLLFHFFRWGLCCLLTGTFVYHVAGILNYFDEASVFVILTYNQLLNLIFQKLPMAIDIFYFDSFKFQFWNSFPEEFVYNYLVTGRETDFSLMIYFFGVPSHKDCIYRSN